MIIVNGSIQLLKQSAASAQYDTNGDPVGDAQMSAFGEIKGCNLLQRSADRKGGAESGLFSRLSYEVLLPTSCEEFEGEFARLYDARGKDLGDFKVQSIEYLDAVQAIKLICDANKG